MPTQFITNPRRSPDNVDYKFYSTYVNEAGERKITGGWEYREDAADAVREMVETCQNIGWPAESFKVYSRAFLVRSGIDPKVGVHWDNPPQGARSNPRPSAAHATTVTIRVPASVHREWEFHEIDTYDPDDMPEKQGFVEAWHNARKAGNVYVYTLSAPAFAYLASPNGPIHNTLDIARGNEDRRLVKSLEKLAQEVAAMKPRSNPRRPAAKNPASTRRTNPAPKYICTNDRYCPTPDTFSSLSDFQAMCEAVFGMRVHLASVGGDTYVDERGEVVLRPARRPAARRKNPASSRPSVKTLSQIVSDAEAKELRNLMESASVAHVLRAADRMMDGFGVEYIRSSNDTVRTPDGLDYVNMGDTYDLTLVYDHNKGKYVVSSWGDIVEADMGLPKSRQRFAD